MICLGIPPDSTIDLADARNAIDMMVAMKRLPNAVLWIDSVREDIEAEQRLASANSLF